MQATVDLPTQLKALSVPELRARAAEEGCTPEQIDEARLEDAPKVALAELILKKVAEKKAEEDRKQAATAELQKLLEGMAVKALVPLAKGIPAIDVSLLFFRKSSP